MLIIGKRINTVRKRVLQAYQEKDNNYIREEHFLLRETHIEAHQGKE